MWRVKERSRVEQFERIRRERRDEGRSIRELAKRHQVHRRTVRAALADALPPARKVPKRAAAVLGVYEGTVRRWLTEDLKAPRKQRHTARRVWQRLIEEEGAVVAESSVRALVAQLKVEVGLARRQVSVPQTHAPAQEAEVDFGEFTAVIAGTMMKVWMFVLRLSHSGKAVHIAYANQAQESFLDGHVQAFDRPGGVPIGRIRYNNLKPAVIRCALGGKRFEHPRFIALRSRYSLAEPTGGSLQVRWGVSLLDGRACRGHGAGHVSHGDFGSCRAAGSSGWVAASSGTGACAVRTGGSCGCAVAAVAEYFAKLEPVATPANILRTDAAAHRPLPADTELVQAIAVLARAQQDAVWNRPRLSTQLRSHRKQYYPAALAAFQVKGVWCGQPRSPCGARRGA